MGALDKFLTKVGLYPGEAEEDPDMLEEEEFSRDMERQQLSAPEPARKSTKSANMMTSTNLVGFPSGLTMHVVISEPVTFKDAYELADQLNSRKQVIINLEKTPRENAQRIIDFLSGTVHAISGQSQQIGAFIFVFTPRNMEIDAKKQQRGENRYTNNPVGDYSIPNGEEAK